MIGGTSGCGKSTLLKLLMRFWRIQNGTLLISEKSIEEINEAVILKSLKSEAGKKTILLVSHRQSTLRIADQLFTMEKV